MFSWTLSFGISSSTTFSNEGRLDVVSAVAAAANFFRFDSSSFSLATWICEEFALARLDRASLLEPGRLRLRDSLFFGNALAI